MKKLKALDYVIIVIIVGVLVGALAFLFNLKRTAPSVVMGEKPVEIQVFFKNVLVTTSDNPFKVDEESFITIRNVPYTKLKIAKVEYDKKKVVIPAQNSNGYAVVEDKSQPFQYDFLITLADNAKITDDGAVVGGNKLKMGLPIVLEGKDYKFTGIVSGVKIVDAPAAN